MQNTNKKKYTSGSIAQLLAGELVGATDIELTGIAEPAHCGKGDILVVKKDIGSMGEALSRASLVVTSKKYEIPAGINSISVDDIDLAFIRILDAFDEYSNPIQEIHPSAIIHSTVLIGNDVSIGSNVQIGEGTRIGDGVILYPNVVIGRDVSIGDRTVVHPSVTIYDKTVIGKDCLFKANSAIGSKGFGYHPVNGVHYTIPQIGIVRIGDHVDIGACCCIDRATIGETVIEDWVKIDNLVQIAHNNHIGKGSIICAQTGISGSCTLGEYVVLTGQVGVSDHVKIGDKAFVGAQSGIPRDIPAGEAWFGYPARPMMPAKRIEAIISKLPELYKDINKLIAGAKKE